MFISIITVSYNAERLLGDFLDSIQKLNYPKSKFETIVVDNGSTDGSVSLIKKNYPEVRVLEAGENLGFGKGNNFGMKRAKGDLYFLVNNDTALEPDSLRNIVATFKRWSKKAKIGAVNSKLVLYDKYFPLKVMDAYFAGYKVNKAATPVNRPSYILPHVRVKKYCEEVLIPFAHDCSGDLDLEMSFKLLGSKVFTYSAPGVRETKCGFLERRKNRTIKLKIKESALKRDSVELIQNAGNVFFRDGHARDRGANIIRHKQYYETDIGQYGKEEYVDGFCGAGVLLNKKALDNVGYFDEDFFFYYEDGDLSLRFRKGGWKILYTPKSVIRHIHAASSKEWSPFFVFNSEKNRLLMIAKHWPRLIFLRQWLEYFIKNTLGVPIFLLVKGDGQKALERFKLRMKVNFRLALQVLKSFFVGKRLSTEELKEFS